MINVSARAELHLTLTFRPSETKSFSLITLIICSLIEYIFNVIPEPLQNEHFSKDFSIKLDLRRCLDNSKRPNVLILPS